MFHLTIMSGSGRGIRSIGRHSSQPVTCMIEAENGQYAELYVYYNEAGKVCFELRRPLPPTNPPHEIIASGELS